MSKIDEVRSAMVAAMKAGEKERKAALSFLLSSLKNKAIDKRADLTEEEENQVILKEIKQLKETIEMTPADRTDLLEEAEKRLAVLEEYAPKMMSEDEIKAVISDVISGLGIEKPLPKDKGRIMKELMPKVKGIHAVKTFFYIFDPDPGAAAEDFLQHAARIFIYRSLSESRDPDSRQGTVSGAAVVFRYTLVL